MRVLLISHTCQSLTEGQPKAKILGQMPDVELRLLAPDRWYHYGRWRTAQKPHNASFRYEVGKILWPWSGPGQWYLHWYPGLARTIKSFQPDIIDLWEEPWGLVSAHTCWLRNHLLPSAKIVSETEQNINRTLPFPFESFRSYTLNNADFAVGRDVEAVEVLRAKGYSGPAETVANAVDAELFQPLDKEECRRELGLSGFVIGFAGRLVLEKGLLDIVEALPLCPPDVQVVFLGTGPLQPDLEKRIAELNKTQQVHFLQARPQHELPKIINAFDVFMLLSHTTPTWKEQFGRTIIEANACGVPVIGSDSGAIPRVIDQAGLVVPEKNPTAIAAAINELYSDRTRTQELGHTGRQQVLERYTWEKVAQHMHRIYLKVLHQAD